MPPSEIICWGRSASRSSENRLHGTVRQTRSKFSIVISDIKNSPLTKVAVRKTRHSKGFEQYKNSNPGPLDSRLRALTNWAINYTVLYGSIKILIYWNIFRKKVVFMDFLSGELFFARLHFWNQQLEGFQKSIGLPMLSPKSAEIIILALKWRAWSSCQPGPIGWAGFTTTRREW